MDERPYGCPCDTCALAVECVKGLACSAYAEYANTGRPWRMGERKNPTFQKFVAAFIDNDSGDFDHEHVATHVSGYLKSHGVVVESVCLGTGLSKPTAVAIINGSKVSKRSLVAVSTWIDLGMPNGRERKRTRGHV